MLVGSENSMKGMIFIVCSRFICVGLVCSNMVVVSGRVSMVIWLLREEMRIDD